MGNFLRGNFGRASERLLRARWMWCPSGVPWFWSFGKWVTFEKGITESKRSASVSSQSYLPRVHHTFSAASHVPFSHHLLLVALPSRLQLLVRHERALRSQHLRTTLCQNTGEQWQQSETDCLQCRLGQRCQRLRGCWRQLCRHVT